MKHKITIEVDLPENLEKLFSDNVEAKTFAEDTILMCFADHSLTLIERMQDADYFGMKQIDKAQIDILNSAEISSSV